jgi:hypothetical protein
MALELNDRVQQTGTANTTVSFTLVGLVTGFQDFSVVGDGNTTYYAATDATGSWEVGVGTYSTTGPTLTRTTILASSSSGSAETFSGTVNVWVTYPSEQVVILDASGNVTALGTITSGTWQGSTVGVAYGGTGVTTSSGPNSVVLRNGYEDIVASRISQSVDNVTATGGTTTLTAASKFWQTLQGTGPHTFIMPDATSLPIGFWFIFDNDSTGNLTVQDYGFTTLDVIAPGGYTMFYLDDVTSVAGSWNRAGLIPSEVNWGTNSLDLGGSTVITNGVWQGVPVAYNYGGTGLNSFVAANNALYSTSATTLTAGTLPVAAGGTGQTTANGAFNALAPSQATNSGKYLTTNGTDTSWATVTQTTFSAGTTGFTPNTATSGTVTLGGTLNVSNGGTGAITLTGYVKGNGTSAFTASSTIPSTDISGLGTMSSQNANAVAITGGSINGTSVGGTTAAAGAFTTLSATGVTTVQTGSAAAPAISPTGDTNTGIFFPAADTIAFAEGGVEAMRIDANGNVGIGATPRAWGSGTKALQIGSAGTLLGDGFGNASLSSNSYFDGSNWIRVNSSSPAVYSVSSNFTWRLGTSGTTGSASPLPVVMELNAYGLTVGDIFTPNSGNLTVRETLSAARVSSNGDMFTTDLYAYGNIYSYGNITAYFSSDVRLKENIKDVDNALDKVCAIGSKTFDWTDDYVASRGGEDGYFVQKSDFGVVAQDVQEVFPQAVRTREDGTLAVDYVKLATLAFGAIKELVKRVEALEAK